MNNVSTQMLLNLIPVELRSFKVGGQYIILLNYQVFLLTHSNVIER